MASSKDIVSSNESANRRCGKSSAAAWIAIGFSALINVIAVVGFAFTIRGDLVQAKYDIAQIIERIKEKRIDDIPYLIESMRDHEKRIRDLEHR